MFAQINGVRFRRFNLAAALSGVLLASLLTLMGWGFGSDVKAQAFFVRHALAAEPAMVADGLQNASAPHMTFAASSTRAGRSACGSRYGVDVSRFPRSWSGGYRGTSDNGNGPQSEWRDLRLEIDSVSADGTISGTCFIDGTPAYRVRGWIDLDTRQVSIWGTEWIEQGHLVYMCRFDGTLSRDYGHMEGEKEALGGDPHPGPWELDAAGTDVRGGSAKTYTVRFDTRDGRNFAGGGIAIPATARECRAKYGEGSVRTVGYYEVFSVPDSDLEVWYADGGGAPQWIEGSLCNIVSGIGRNDTVDPYDLARGLQSYAGAFDYTVAYDARGDAEAYGNCYVMNGGSSHMAIVFADHAISSGTRFPSQGRALYIELTDGRLTGRSHVQLALGVQ